VWRGNGSSALHELFRSDGSDTRAFGINSVGQVVGRYMDPTGVEQAFLRYTGGSSRTFSAPGGVLGTWAQDINDRGDIVGVYFDADFAAHGFLLRDGQFSSIDFPGALETKARSIDALGRITGNYLACTRTCAAGHPDPLEIGFVLDRTGFHSVFFPGTDSTDVWDEVANVRVGDWSDLAGNVFGYVEEGRVFTDTNVPGSSVTSIRGINHRGTLVGVFGDEQDNLHGFAKVPRGFMQLDVPGSIGTVANRINDQGTVVGASQDDQGEWHGFVPNGWEGERCREGRRISPRPHQEWRRDHYSGGRRDQRPPTNASSRSCSSESSASKRSTVPAASEPAAP
jgi:uncharacterized membrane protein